MLAQRSIFTVARRAAVSPAVKRSFTSSFVRRNAAPPARATGGADSEKKMKKFEEIQSESDLMPPGASIGSVPTDLEQATGLERLEILGKMQGVDIFNMAPLDASRKGTMEEPIVLKCFGEEQYVGCTGYPADSHVTTWVTISKDRPIERCFECGNVYKMDFCGPTEDAHAHDDHGHGDHHDHHAYVEPKTFADYIKPEYRYR